MAERRPFLMHNSVAPLAEIDQWCCLEVEHLAAIIGTSVSELNTLCGDLFPGMDFCYKVIPKSEWGDIVLDILRKIDKNVLSVSGEERQPAWQKGWTENLVKFEQSHDMSALVPAYVRPGEILRINGSYARSRSDSFELDFYTVLRTYLFKKYCHEVDNVYEFGCGTGYNLVMLAQMYSEKKLYGLDWAQASVDLVNTISQHYNYNLSGVIFDMFDPDKRLVIAPNSAVITLNSMEQLGQKWDKLLDYFLASSPAICIHAEPFAELYDENSLYDYLSLRYHVARNYLNGYLARLRELEGDGQIEIIKTHRVPLGSRYHEGYSIVIWKPKVES